MDYIKNIFSNFSMPELGINTFIDIFVVTIVIYYILMWIKETRAWALFKGIGIIVLINVIASIFNLYTVSWIISNTLNIGILAALILFQPELRKVLEQLGKGRFTKIFGGENEKHGIIDNTVEEIITAIERMAEARTGALIVIEEQVALGDLESTGIVIDAVITSKLLINIFEDKTPLHDGAVIIRNNRIAAASCILPLTLTEVPDELGTRHRAAIGASEVSDARVLIVSEETGQISVVQGGKLYRDLAADEVRSMLSENKLPKKHKGKLWKGRRK